MRLLTLCAAILLAASILSAQSLSVGVIGGVTATSQTPTGHDESKRYVVGPSVELRLPAGFAIEADALYQRIGNSFTGLSLSQQGTYTSRMRGNSWEFPILGKYYFRPKTAPFQPFVSTGYAFRKIWWTNDQASNSVRARSDYTSATSVGAVFGGGVRFSAGRFAVAPEFRYTRWGDSNNTPRNQAQVLVGIRF